MPPTPPRKPPSLYPKPPKGTAPFPGYGSMPVMGPTIFGTPPYVGPGGTPPFWGGSGSGYPPVDPGTIPEIPQRQPRNPYEGSIQIGPGAGAATPQGTNPPLPPNPDQDRTISPEEAAAVPPAYGPDRYTPDLVPPGKKPPFGPVPGGAQQPQQQGPIGRFFSNLTASPNVESMYTAGSILAGNPQSNESQLQQAVRAIGGAMSTRGAYAQMQAQQAEARRKAGLEAREQSRKETDTSSMVLDRADQNLNREYETWIKERKQSDEAFHNRVMEGIDKNDSDSLGKLRGQTGEKMKVEMEALKKEWELAERELKNKILNESNEHVRELLKQSLEKRKQIFFEKVDMIRAQAYAQMAATQAKSSSEADSWLRAIQGFSSVKAIGDIKNPREMNVENLVKMYELIEAEKAKKAAGGKGVQEPVVTEQPASTPTPDKVPAPRSATGNTAAAPGPTTSKYTVGTKGRSASGKPAVWDGTQWVLDTTRQ